MSGRTDWADGFIAVDWGTTNRRAYVIQGGRLADEFEDDRGVLSIDRGDFGAAVREIRDRLGGRPMLLAGMIGSNRGWKETPYVPCPAGLDEVAEALVWPDERTAIVPGVSYSNDRADVMRGEEVQILGAVASGKISDDCLVCHPGTHNKWIQVAGGRIQSFRTVMTGELFNLLKERSILAELLEGEAEADDAFRDGAGRTLSGTGVTAALFEARAGYLLERHAESEGASFISGILIGEDVRVGLAEYSDSKLVVMGRPDLTGLYSAALELAGVDSEQLDGEEAFVAGASGIAERIR